MWKPRSTFTEAIYPRNKLYRPLRRLPHNPFPHILESMETLCYFISSINVFCLLWELLNKLSILIGFYTYLLRLNENFKMLYMIYNILQCLFDLLKIKNRYLLKIKMQKFAELMSCWRNLIIIELINLKQ